MERGGEEKRTSVHVKRVNEHERERYRISRGLGFPSCVVFHDTEMLYSQHF